jgi:SWI/SNF-related matrix-associated actin-dependent regulator of chromatin subfamily A-like protein 1
MQLDFNPSNGAYILRVPRSERELVQALVREHGLDFSTTASTPETAVLFTREPYAAASFADVATPRARASMEGMLNEIAASWAPTSQSHFWCPPDHELWGFQRADLDYALRRKNTLVADQPGLGKTPIAICYANEIKARHVGVICPANIRRQWERRIREWSRMSWEHGRGCIVHSVTSGRRGVAPVDDYAASWNIVSYDLARTPAIGAALARQKYDLLIFDEAHYLKTIDSKRTRAIFGGGEKRHFDAIAPQAEHLLALTGTPLPNRPREAYTLCRGMNWDAIDWMSEDHFSERFNPSLKIDAQRPDGTWYTYVDERSGRHGELQNRLRASFMTRHLKRDVMTQLKLPVFDVIQVEDNEAVRQALHAEQLLDIDPENFEGKDALILGHVAVVRHQMGLAMAPLVADYIDMLVAGGEDKLVVFAWHVDVLDILQQRWEKHGVLRIDGRDSGTSKDRKVQEFIRDPRKKIILGNTLAMGTGTDGLQEVCAHALIAEPDWTPGVNIQAFDRLDRGGQTGTVQGDIFVAPNSIAERILASALRKLKVTDAALDKRMVLS